MPIYIRDKTGKTMRPYPPSATAAPLQEPKLLANFQLVRVTLSPVPGNATSMNVVVSDAHREIAAFELDNAVATALDGCLGLTVDAEYRVQSTPLLKLCLNEQRDCVDGIDAEGNEHSAIEWPSGCVSFAMLVAKDRDAFIALVRHLRGDIETYSL